MLKILLGAKDIDVNKETSAGWIPLTKAIDLGNPEILKVLLDAKDIDANKEVSDKLTPLIFAIAK